MAKYGDKGLGYEIVRAVQGGLIVEPITFKKVKDYCEGIGVTVEEKYIRVILSNASHNEHSPTYKKYFERVGRGEYNVLSEYKNQEQYYWLNVDSYGYNWSFFNVKLGTTQTYFSVNEGGNKRKNERCFVNIKVGDWAVAYETSHIRAITALCRVTEKFEKDGIISVTFQKVEDYETACEWDRLKEAKALKDCKIVTAHWGTLFEIEKVHYETIVQMLKELNAETSDADDFYREIQKSLENSEVERRKRLEQRNSVYPDVYETRSKTFKRNADVVAEVLIRANGVCEKCNKEAPFKRRTDGTPYLEVHHIVRLADGGADTVANAIAVCPNCHRELHFG